jgi:fumarylpyruvate hydrolase
MESFVFLPPPRATVSISGISERFPVHRIYCVGRNFAEHAREMGAETPKGTPVFFMKPADAVIQAHDIPFPTQTGDLHHEVELVVALGPDIPERMTAGNALQAVFAYGVGLDLTRRDLQAAAKEKRLPWDTAKGFDASAPLSALVLKDGVALSAQTCLSLQVNGVERQRAVLGDMIFTVPDILVELSGLFRLKAGDLIFMGTPAGVAALHKGDTFTAKLDGVISFSGAIV